jgi:photosynthetic reaction center cytochrome c subunit
MKLNILRLLVITLAGISVLLVISNARGQKSAPANHEFAVPPSSLGIITPAQTLVPQTAAPQEKTVEQARKNIKVLIGLPDSQLIPVMNFIAASLGRRCNFCHVNKNAQWDFPADDKPEKTTARDMIKMVLEVNKTTFKGNLEVSCYTCHRGRNQPLSLPPLPLPLPSPPPANSSGPGGPGGAPPPAGAGTQATPTPAPALPSADDIVNKYVAAIGGQAAIDKIKTRVMKGTITTANGMTITYEIDQVAPDKSYESFSSQRGTGERALNGNTGWEKNPQGVREITGQQLADLKQALYLFRNLKLKEQYSSVRVTGKDKIGDREVYAVRATTPDDKRERLFFDAENGLLLRRITYTQTMIGIIPEETDFDDYREVEGVKFPFMVKISSVDAGNPYSTRAFTEIKLNVPVDDSKFKMPAATPPKPTNP